jgi:hypothetical protein
MRKEKKKKRKAYIKTEIEFIIGTNCEYIWIDFISIIMNHFTKRGFTFSEVCFTWRRRDQRNEGSKEEQKHYENIQPSIGKGIFDEKLTIAIIAFHQGMPTQQQRCPSELGMKAVVVLKCAKCNVRIKRGSCDKKYFIPFTSYDPMLSLGCVLVVVKNQSKFARFIKSFKGILKVLSLRSFSYKL